jgi:hypothetical protein
MIDATATLVESSAVAVAQDEERLQPQSASQGLVERCRAAMESMHADDREEAVNLIEAIHNAEQQGNSDALEVSTKALNEFLFFIEGR